jgi:hypothetical protein
MRHRNRWFVAVLLVAGLQLPACGGSSDDGAQAEPATVEQLAGSDRQRVTLTAQAAERVGIRTAALRTEAGAKIVPYAALLYDAQGGTFVYVSPTPLTFVRAPVSVDYIEGARAVLSDGPADGSAVVTIGAAELLGAEFGVG